MVWPMEAQVFKLPLLLVIINPPRITATQWSQDAAECRNSSNYVHNNLFATIKYSKNRRAKISELWRTENTTTLKWLLKTQLEQTVAYWVMAIWKELILTILNQRTVMLEGTSYPASPTLCHGQPVPPPDEAAQCPSVASGTCRDGTTTTNNSIQKRFHFRIRRFWKQDHFDITFRVM